MSHTRADVIGVLQRHETELKKLGVEHLFCSDRSHATTPMPIRTLISFLITPQGRLGLYELMDVKERARQILGRPTDIMTRASLHPALRKRIEEAALRVF